MNYTRKEDMKLTSEEALARSSSWTLACDNALLNRLKAFSESLTENSQEISKECDNLSKDVSQLNYRLMNVTNEFLMLSNTQFVENRVEEFEEFSTSMMSSSSSTTANSKTKAEKEAELISKMKQAIQLGLGACNDAREKNGKVRSRFKMKQPYLIGSPKFFSSKYCGLVDESRRNVACQQFADFDSMSLSETSDITSPELEVKPAVTFTMPPQQVPPLHQIPESNANFIGSASANGSHLFAHGVYGRTDAPHSPTISDRSGDASCRSASVCNEPVPRSVTDELNKIYASFAPPPTVTLPEDDSDDDFRPTPAGGRLFEDDDDDLFGEKQLFSPGKNNSDFFGKSNPTKLPTPVFTEPPPIKSPHMSVQQPAIGDLGALPGDKPKPNISPYGNVATNASDSKEEALFHDDVAPVPGNEGLSRPKLPPGAVSIFGGLPPPVFHNGTLQATQPTKNIANSERNTQISSAPGIEASSGFPASKSKDNRSSVLSSQKSEDVNTRAASQSIHTKTIGRTEAKSQGSLSEPVVTNRSSKNAPLSTLFADDSSDEDIFFSNKRPKQTIQVSQNFGEKNQLPSASTSKEPSTNLLGSRRESPKYKVKKSIFDDSESDDDDLFSGKTLTQIQHKTTSKSFVKATSVDSSVVQVPLTKNSVLFGGDSDPNLFQNTKSPAEKPSSSYPVPSKMEVSSITADESSHDFSSKSEKLLNEDTLSESLKPDGKYDEVDSNTAHRTEVSVPNASEENVQLPIDEPKPVNSPIKTKISEKIKAMQNINANKPEKSGSDDSNNNNENDSSTDSSKPLKPKISVKALALSLNLNPLAMKVGAKPPKPNGSTSNSSTPDGDVDSIPSVESESPKIKEISSPIVSGNEPLQNILSDGGSTTKEDGIDHFVTIIKARPRIQQKRRPPSRVFLKSLATSSEKEDEDITDSAKTEQSNDSNVEQTNNSTSSNDITDGIMNSESLHIKADADNERSIFSTTEEIGSLKQIEEGSTEKVGTESSEETEGSHEKVTEVFPNEEPSEQTNVITCDEDNEVDKSKTTETESAINGADPLLGNGETKQVPLFNEDSDDDLFSSRVKQKPLEVEIGNTKQKEEVVSEIEETKEKEKQPTKLRNRRTSKSIFDDSESDDDLFSSKRDKSKSKNSHSLLSSKSKTNRPEKTTQPSLFGEDSDSDSDLFKSKSVNSKLTEKAKDNQGEQAETQTSVKVIGDKPSFFDSSDEN